MEGSSFRLAVVSLGLITLSLGFAPCGAIAGDEARVEGTVPAALGSTRITGDALLRQVEWLTRPRWRGRETGSAESDTLARQLADRLRAAGWKPAVADSSFFDFYPIATGVRVEGSIGLRDNERGYAFGPDWTPIAISGDGHALSELAFVGYGLSAPERGYDDYAGLPVTGKVVFAFLGEPGRTSGKGLHGRGASPYASLYRKAETALLHGAAALVVAAPPSETPAPTTAWRLASGVGARDAGIPVAMITPRAARDLMHGLALSDLEREIDAKLAPRSRALPGRRAEVLVALRRGDGVARSAIAMLPATGSQAGGAVLLLASLSGGGMGPDGAHPTLHPSANDDGSAVAALLEIAEVFPRVPRTRKIYLALVSGRELGGAGARSLAAKLPDVSTVVLLHSFGHAGHTRVECESQVLAAALAEANTSLPKPVELEPSPTLSSWSELVPFLGRGIELIAILGPGAPSDGTPADRSESLDREGFTQRARFAFGAAQVLARR